MDREQWAKEYARLCTAYGKSPNTEQARVYFAALDAYPIAVVADAVTEAVRESRGFPTAADLSDRAVRIRRGRPMAPAGACGRCHGSTWIELHCAGVSAESATAEPRPVDRSHCCGRTWVHADHGFAVRCDQCWGLRGEVA